MFTVTQYDDGNITISDGHYSLSIWEAGDLEVAYKYDMVIGPKVLYKLFPEIEPYKFVDGRDILCRTKKELLNEVLWWMRRLSVREASSVYSKVRSML